MNELAMNELALQLLWRVTLALLLILFLRHLVRRVSGAVAGYALWALLPALLLAMCLPSWGGSMAPALHMPTLGRTLVYAGAEPATRAAMSAIGWTGVLWGVWLIGCVWKLLRMLRLYADTARACEPMSQPDQDHWTARLRALSTRRLPALAWHPLGPALLGAVRPRLLLPRDFRSRYPTLEQTLILRHELMHQAHGDGCWNLLAELLGAAFWFHPLLPFALRRFRLDQEAACDCAVLSQQPHAAGAYGRALLNTHSDAAIGVAAHWLQKPSLKERMTMLKLHSISSNRRRLGLACVLALTLGTAWATQTQNPPAQASSAANQAPAADSSASKAHTTPPSKNIRLSAGIKPRYPIDAIKNKETGKVIVSVLVGTDGSVKKVRLVGDKPVYPSLAQSAMTWVRKLKFNPGTRNGKPYAGWARIPVTFTLNPIGKTSASRKKTTAPTSGSTSG